MNLQDSVIMKIVENSQQLELRSFDQDGNFIYVPLLSPSEQLRYGITDDHAKVLVVDLRTGYFNASLFMKSFRDSPMKSLNTQSKTFKTISEHLVDEMQEVFIQLSRRRNAIRGSPDDLLVLQQRAEIDLEWGKYIGLPMFNRRLNRFAAMYIVPNSLVTRRYSGAYVHPDLFLEVAMQANTKLALDISRMSLAAFANHGLDHTHNDLVSDLLEPQDVKIDDIQQRKLRRYFDYQPTTMVKTPKRRQQQESGKNLAVLVKANYDEIYKYGSIEYCLSLMLIAESEINDYSSVLDLVPKHLTKEQIREQLDRSLIPEVKSEIVFKVVSLRDVPTNFVERFVVAYDAHVDIELRDGYVYTTELEEFTKCLSEFLGEWMII